MELYGEQVPQVLFLVLGLVPVDHQPDSLRGLPQHIDGFIVAGFAQVDSIYLRRDKGEVGLSAAETRLVLSQRQINIFKKEENSQFLHSDVQKFTTIVRFRLKSKDICHALSEVHFKHRKGKPGKQTANGLIKTKLN